MRVHLDKKLSDGMAITFFVITLLSPCALAILLMRLHAAFEASAFWSWRHGGWKTASRCTLFGTAVFGTAGKKECRSMHVHMDRKWLEWLDGNGNAIAFILIALLIVMAFAY
jgi:hypothetical protein